jgi:hypothetical protein
MIELPETYRLPYRDLDKLNEREIYVSTGLSG